MKNTTIAGALALMGVVLFSCAKEMSVKSLEENTAVSGKAVTITATATVAETKTTYVDNAGTIEVNWEASESFKAYTTGYGTGSELTFTKTDDATTQSATFQTTGNVSDGTKLYAVYDPSSKFTGGNTIDLTNAYVTNVNNLKNYDVMFAEGTVSGASVNFAFTHKLSFFKVTLNRGSLTAAGNDNDLKLTLVFNNCKKVGGYTYTGCEFNENVLTRTITLAAGDVPAANASTTIYVAMPPLEYEAAVSPVSSGLTASYSKIFALKDGKSIAAGTVYSTSVPFAPDHTTAVFGSKGGNCSYNASQYYWVKTSDNMMKVFTFESGELQNYTKLSFKFSNNNSGTYGVRCGYYVGNAFTSFNSGGAYFTAGSKEVDLTTLGVDLSTVTAIAFGGNNSGTVPGYCDINEAEFILTGTSVDPLTSTFTKPGTNACNHTFSWKATSDNLMYCFNFANGELAQYSSLKFTLNRLISTESTPQIRINFVYDGGNMTIGESGKNGIFQSDGEKTITMSNVSTALATESKTLKDVTAIRIGGQNTNSGACGIVSSDMYLTK